MKKVRFIAAVLFFAFSAAACMSARDAGSGNSNLVSMAPSERVTALKDANIGTGSGGGGGGGGAQSPLVQQISLNQAEDSRNQPTQIERKIIRHADLNLEAEQPEESMTKITGVVESKGGFVVDSQQSSSDVKATTRDVMTMNVRVPAARFNETLDEIRKTASRVIVETVTGEDVTEEFIDIEARLKTEKALEQQFIEIMKQAKTVQEALNVQRELANVRGEIEKIEGRKRFLQNQASLSTIKIRLQKPNAVSASSSGFLPELGQAFGRGLDAALGFILGLVTFVVAILPFLLLVVLPVVLVIRYFLKKRLRRKE
ncbi:MAG: DUF4349 domain-containing protein, partial [Acidobacteriota bacterium]|nr:DUF4349 domain-containing protein [Acidobacteriota bacterium]